MTYIEMKQKDIVILKEKLWRLNNKKCPVLNKEIPLNKMVLDHIHKSKTDNYSPTKGTIREALDFRVNAVLGKLENSIVRSGLNKDPDFSISEFLRNAADYFDKGAYVEDVDNEKMYFIHPNEVKKPKLMKSSYNMLKKLKQGIPVYPKSQKLTKKLEDAFKEMGVEPEFYGY